MKRITIRIEDDLHERLRTAAEHDHRSVHGQLLWILERALTDSREETKP